MPRTAIILGRKHGEEKFVMLRGPDTDLNSQKEQFTKFLEATAEGTHGVYAEVQFWTSTEGEDRTLKFRSTPEQKAYAAAQDAATKAHKAHLDKLANPKADAKEAKEEAPQDNP